MYVGGTCLTHFMQQFEPSECRVEVDNLDARDAVACAEKLLRHRRGAEVDELLVVARWADLHSDEPPPTETHQRFGDRLIQVGGDGTPPVREFSLAELAVDREQHPLGMRQVMSDTLDLVHRLPRCWVKVLELECDAWVARKIARLTHHLTQAQAELVDQAVAVMLGVQAIARVFTVVEAKVIEADPDGHAARIAAEATRRGVYLGRSSDAGLRTIFARIDAGDATWVDAMVDRVARILRCRGVVGTHDELRAQAFGWLARPAELLALLLESERDSAEHRQPDDAGAAEDAREPDDAGVPDPTEDEFRSRTTAFPEDLLERLTRIDPGKLRPDSVLHVHLHQGVLEGLLDGVARCEGLGPFLPEQLTDLLRGSDVTVAPVIDLADQISTNCYEHPESVKDRVFQIINGDYFPYAPSLSRHLDYDHVRPYDPDGPPGQTGIHNSGPLTRRHHRIKTHARGWAVRQPGPGIYVWRTPHGLYRLTNHEGTHRLTEDEGVGYFTEGD